MKLPAWLAKLIQRFSFLLVRTPRPRIVALVGPSGTGKSFRATIIAERFGIRCILDDGILIKDQKIIAGKSAKRETVYLSAVKTALFADEAHRRDVRTMLDKIKPRTLLMLATSDKMILKICSHLGLAKPSRTIYIHEIATEEEISMAQESRMHHGRHVIPVPSREVRRSAPGIVDDSIKVVTRPGLFKSERMYEKTIVRPLFSARDPVQIPMADLRRSLRQTISAHIPEVRITSTSINFDDGYEILARIVPPRGASFAIDQVQHQIRAYLQMQTGTFIKKLVLIPEASRYAKR